MSQPQQNSDRTRNFRTRVSLEREVLAIVNATGGVPELLGLTAAAIEDWQKRANSDNPSDRVKHVKAILLAIARETGTVTDQSREVVSQEKISGISPKLIDELFVALRSVSS